METIKSCVANRETGAVRVMVTHHGLVNRNRKAERRFLVVMNGRNLQRGVVRLVEDGSAVEDQKRHVAILDPVEILRRRDVEVVGAGHRELDLYHLPKRWHRDRRLRPQHASLRLVPAVSRTEELDEALL